MNPSVRQREPEPPFSVQGPPPENAGILTGCSAETKKMTMNGGGGVGIDNINLGHKVWVNIPYIRGLSEIIKNTLKEHGVTAFYKSQNNSWSRLKTNNRLRSVPTLYEVLPVEGEGCVETYVRLFSPSEPG